jgi:3,5-epimerase/4-reductase
MENSMTVLPELLPLMIDMAIKKQTGTINLTNPGAITHNDILEMYKEIVDPDFTWQNFSVEEQDKILLSGRSNNVLETIKLQELFPNVKPIKESIREVLENYK